MGFGNVQMAMCECSGRVSLVINNVSKSVWGCYIVDEPSRIIGLQGTKMLFADWCEFPEVLHSTFESTTLGE